MENVCERYIAEKPEDYIIGGRPAKPEEYPWMVMTLVMRHKKFFRIFPVEFEYNSNFKTIGNSNSSYITKIKSFVGRIGLFQCQKRWH